MLLCFLAREMSSAGSGMAGSQYSVGGSSGNTTSADGEDAGAGVVNQKYPLWALLVNFCTI